MKPYDEHTLAFMITHQRKHQQTCTSYINASSTKHTGIIVMHASSHRSTKHVGIHINNAKRKDTVAYLTTTQQTQQQLLLLLLYMPCLPAVRVRDPDKEDDR